MDTSNTINFEEKMREREAAKARALNEPVITLEFVRISDVEAEPIDWLWRNRLASGKITLISGDPEIGKSQAAIDIAARTTKGAKWPDEGNARQGSVVILSAEDGTNDTLRPRLEAAGANLEHVHVLTATMVDGKSATFSLQAHLEMLGRKLAQLNDAALVIIDPITSYLGKIDGHKTVDVRNALEPLAAFAEKYDIAVLAISHPPKATQSKAINAVTGSLAFVAAPRMVFIAIRDPEDEERRLLLPVKNNIGPHAPGLGFSVEGCVIGNGISTSRVLWDDQPVTTTADEAVAAANNKGGGSLAEAMKFLQQELAAGPRSTKILQQVAKNAGLSWSTIRRAQKELSINPKKGGFLEGWIWELPKPDMVDGLGLGGAQ